MRLSGIKIAGFKSFVDPVQLPLPSNLTAIVGPNGCGKSNIIDAVRWVLGETSMRTLRSESMEDVIFNGSKARKPVGRASVELIFDNSDGTISGPYAAYSEVSVRRELTRDGNSQYYLNGRKCKKRDVTDLFLGTGLGLRSGYAIIEQGMVSRMVEAKPDELRQWLEEAAGISRYKERRRETESRMRATRENLDRLNDLRAELASRLATLQRQARNAEKFREYKARERRLRGELLVLRWRELRDECARHEQRIAELETALREAEARVGEARATLEAAGNEQRRASDAVGQVQGRVYAAEAELARIDQSLQHARELRDVRRQELARLTQQAAALEASERDARARKSQLAAQIERHQRELAEAEERCSGCAEALKQAEAELARAEQAWESFTERAEEPLARTEGARVRLRELERGSGRLETRLSTLRGEREGLDPEAIRQALADSDAELSRVGEELELLRKRLAELDEQLAALREQRAAGESALHEARQALSDARGRLSSLETLQQAALREDDDELRAYLASRHLGDVPRLAAVLRVEPGWEAAVEHVLGPLLQAPLSPDLDALLAAGGEPPQAGVAVVSDAESGQAEAPPDSLAARVEGPRVLRSLLAGVRCVPDLAAAIAARRQLAPDESLITPDGTWLGRDFVRHPRRGDAASGVIARGMLLRRLRDEVARLDATVREREQALGALREQLGRMERERSQLAARFDQRRHAQAQRMAQRQAQAVRLEQAERRVEELDAAIAAATEERERHVQELAAARAELEALEREAEALRAERSRRQQELAQVRQQLTQARESATQAEAARGRIQVQLASAQSQLGSLGASLQELAERREALARRIAEHEQETAGLDAPVQEQAERLSAARAAVDSARAELKTARGELALAEQRLGNAQTALRQAEAARDACRERLQQARLAFEGIAARRTSVEEQIREAGHDRERILAELPEDASADACAEELEALARRIDRLGPINLAAIEELDEAREREQYLNAQHEDLAGALATLEEAIRKIDRETRERFRKTFDQVNETFKMRFPRLFGGGEAYLELTGDDLLDTGVRVMARPPGKRNSSIQLLSGGEKAMTAVALLLALFELTPAPFCMLDEVDAPLDDANVSRFCETIREMSHNVQFVIITHNKITMELAEQLHGVTMAEPGVSRLVSVDIRQAMEMAEDAA